MSKNDKYMIGRNDGMLYAYRYAKKNGIDALEDEIKMRNLTNFPTMTSRKEIDDCINAIMERTCDAYTIMMVSVLHDEFGFGEQRCQKALDRFMSKVECLNEGYVKWADLVGAIKEELKLDIEFK